MHPSMFGAGRTPVNSPEIIRTVGSPSFSLKSPQPLRPLSFTRIQQLPTIYVRIDKEMTLSLPSDVQSRAGIETES